MKKKNYVRSEVSRNSFSELPASCGVYLLHNESHEIIYVGKAVNIQSRIRSHLRQDHASPLKRDMADEIAIIQFILTQDEHEALLLEEELIKTHQPHYNIRMKDDKSYPYIRFDRNNRFPGVRMARRKTSREGLFFGPYTNAQKARKGLKTLRSLFLLRGCTIPEDRFPLSRPCLDFELGLCSAPCTGFIIPEEYTDSVQKALSFLEGDYTGITFWIEDRMWKASEKLDFEQAAHLRNTLDAVKKIIGRYRLFLPDGSDLDFMEAACDHEAACVVVLKVRKGRLIGSESFTVNGWETGDRQHNLLEFFDRFYLDHFLFPERICVEVEDVSTWKERGEERGLSLQISGPQNGYEKELALFATENAEKNLQLEKAKTLQKKMVNEKILLDLKKTLSLPKIPHLVEGFDISTFQGDESVGAVVSFAEGLPLKKRYRKFIIRESNHPDDFHMMEEVLERYLQKLKRDHSDYPDLILIDGGAGQLSSAQKILQQEQCTVPVVALAKEFEEIYLPGKKKPLRLSADSESLQFLQRVRNEVHRFVITFHRTRRNKQLFHSLLEEIPGIGPRRRTILLSAFDDLHEILDQDANILGRKLQIPVRCIQAVQEKLSTEQKKVNGTKDGL